MQATYQEAGTGLETSVLLRDRNPLQEYIRNYIVLNQPVAETCRHKLLRYGANLLGTGFGLVAGLPYLHVCFTISNHFIGEDLALGIPIAICLMTSYGATSIYTFWDILEMLEPRPSALINTIVLRKSLLRGIIEHSGCYFFGLLSNVPVVYVTVKYNTSIWYVIISATISFAFNTFGLYKLKDIVLTPLLNKIFGTHLIPEQQILIESTTTLLSQYANNANWDQTEELSGNDSDDEVKFLQALVRAKNNKAEDKQLSCSKSCQATYYLPAMVMYPLLNAISVSVMTYKGLYDLSQSAALSYSLTPLVVIPYLGIDIFTAKSLADMIGNNIGPKCRTRKTQTYMRLHHPVWLIILPLIAIVLALFSEMTSGYVMFNEILDTSLAPAAILFGMSIWLSRVVLGTIGFSSVSFEIVQKVDTWRDKKALNYQRTVKNLQMFSQVLGDANPDVVREYTENNSEYYSELKP